MLNVSDYTNCFEKEKSACTELIGEKKIQLIYHPCHH